MGAYNDDVLFIHIPKTAGWSVKNWMKANLPGVLCPDPDNEEATKKSKLPIGHIPLRDIEKFTGRAPDSWQKIVGIIRNPFDQQVSQWMFWRERYACGERHPHDICAAQYPSIHGWLEDRMCDFHVWYEHRISNDDPWRLKPPGPDTNYENFGGYYLYWLAIDGVIPPNVEIFRTENLDETLPEALQPFARAKISKLGHDNETIRSRNFMRFFSHPDKEKAKHALERIHQKFKWTFDQGHYARMAFEEKDD